MALNDSPRINQLPTQDEKCFLDDLPQDALNKFYAEADYKTSAHITGISKEGVTTITLETPERIQAVKNYIDMLIDLGIRQRPE